ncbi:MAG TPA: methylmalonyl-CoA epimerase [Vicinamibacterales bacterium]|nr:methylmalonyl-CoA epimerase [Vicinamibacterales bacterium]
MKAILDHVGIAVRNVDEALTFYRDALGLHVEVPEEVTPQRVRAHFIPVGTSALELLEATAPDSAIAKYIEKRGPGLHHITLRVDDIRGALVQLKSRGVRLVDEEPRAGAAGALVAFIHPGAAHGVLVELKQAAPDGPTLQVKRLAFGDLQLTALHDGPLKLDGGAMFGVVPRPLWERKAPADDRHRVQLAMRPLLVEADWGRMIIDCGAGDKMDAKNRDIYGMDPEHGLDAALAMAGFDRASIDIALATHLHFDHFGAATVRDGSALVPRFPNARCVIRGAEWEDATHPNERNRASYLQENFVPLKGAGVVDFFEGDRTIKPGVRVERSGGHCAQHQVVWIESGGRSAVFPADIIPTAAHLQDPWVTGYDLFPLDSLAFKKRLIRDVIDREVLVFFEHDPHIAAGYIRENGRERWVEKVL